MDDSIAQYMNELTNGDGSKDFSCDMVSSSIHQISVPVPVELFRQLKAMSAQYKRDANCVAGEILTLGLQQALASLPSDELTQIAQSSAIFHQQQVQKNGSAVEFDSGGT